MTFPNMITLTRILLTPVFMVCFLVPFPMGKLISLAIVVVSEISDVLDGYLARKYNSVTNMGKLIDPLADNLFHFSAFLCFLVLGYAEIWMVAIVFYRETIVSWIRVIAASQDKIVGARVSGKFKAWTQAMTIITVVALVAFESQGIVWVETKKISFWFMCVVTLSTLGSGIDYFYVHWEYIKASFKEK